MYNNYQVFHGTSAGAVPSILRDGFNTELGIRGNDYDLYTAAGLKDSLRPITSHYQTYKEMFDANNEYSNPKPQFDIGRRTNTRLGGRPGSGFTSYGYETMQGGQDRLQEPREIRDWQGQTKADFELHPEVLDMISDEHKQHHGVSYLNDWKREKRLILPNNRLDPSAIKGLHITNLPLLPEAYQDITLKWADKRNIPVTFDNPTDYNNQELANEHAGRLTTKQTGEGASSLLADKRRVYNREFPAQENALIQEWVDPYVRLTGASKNKLAIPPSSMPYFSGSNKDLQADLVRRMARQDSIPSIRGRMARMG